MLADRGNASGSNALELAELDHVLAIVFWVSGTMEHRLG